MLEFSVSASQFAGFRAQSAPRSPRPVVPGLNLMKASREHSVCMPDHLIVKELHMLKEIMHLS